MSIFESNRNPDLEFARIDRVVGHGEVIRAGHPLVDVGEHQVEARLLKVHVGINVHKRVIADIQLVLIAERHGGRLIERSFVLCVVTAVHSEVHVKHVCHFEIQIKVGV